MIYVMTSILNGFDNLRAPLVSPEPGVRYICFTDNPLLPDVPPWEFRPVHGVGELCRACNGNDIDAARTSRLPKILPHLMLPTDADYSIWIDGNFQLRKPASEIVNQELRTEDWAVHMHPARDCVYAEGAILLKEKIGTRSLVEAEIARYRAMNYPEKAGLWANGIIIRRHTPLVNAVCERWWELYSQGCERDQMSFPVARWEADLRINRMQHYPDVFSSPLMKFGWHAAWKDKEPNVEHRPERERIAARVERLRQVVGAGGYGFKLYK